MKTNTPSIYYQYNTISTNSNRGVNVLMGSLPMKHQVQKTVFFVYVDRILGRYV